MPDMYICKIIKPTWEVREYKNKILVLYKHFYPKSDSRNNIRYRFSKIHISDGKFFREEEIEIISKTKLAKVLYG